MKETINLYQDIAERTGGNIYLGVVGPVRTGKSTFVKRLMETLVIPNIDNVYRRERAIDELPQSGSGKTIMTSEPKFIPEEAVEISPDGTSKISVRVIDSVGYMIPGALGAEENGVPRMVTTPWYPEEIPMTQAAELGTKKIMDDHCTIGIVITTDGTIHDIPREDFEDAEKRAITDMKLTGKPFLVIVNSTEPNGAAAQSLKRHLSDAYQINSLCLDCLLMQEAEIQSILSSLLLEFPASEMELRLPGWLSNLPQEHPLKEQLYEALRQYSANFTSLREAVDSVSSLNALDMTDNVQILSIETGTGRILCKLQLKEALFYQILSDRSGFMVESDAELMELLIELASVKREYSKVSDALEQVWTTGYGVVMPSAEEMVLEQPEIVRKGSNYGVRLKATAPSIHMMRADIETEISPMIGEEKQSEDMLRYLQEESQGDSEKLWNTNIFGKSVGELVREGLGAKLRRVSDGSRLKFQNTFSRIINEGSNGLICIILP